MVQGQGYKYGIFKPAPSLEAVYVEDNEESYQLLWSLVVQTSTM